MNAKSSARLFVGIALLIIGLVICLIEVVPALGATTTEMVLASNESPADAKVPRSARTRQHGDEVIFRYQDEGFTAVYLTGSFNDWQPELMGYNADREVWSLLVDLEPGNYRYQYVVEDRDETWEAIDPSNPGARRDKDHGWVSVLEVADPRDDADDLDDLDDPDEEEDDSGFSFEYNFDWDDDDDEDFGDRRRIRRNRERYVHRELDNIYEDKGECWSFQRVDGFSLFANPSLVSREAFGPALKGNFSYGFRSKEWTLSGTLLQPLLENRRLLVRLSAHSGTDYRDQTGIGGTENSLTSAFFCDDYRDYYWREGIAVSLVAFPTSNLRLEAGFESSDFSSLESLDPKALCDDGFTENPAIDEGTLRSYFANARIGTLRNYLDLVYEYSDEDTGGDYDFSQMAATYRSRVHIDDGQYFDFRTRYTTALSGYLPVQRQSPVGGLGTVRGYYYQTMLEEDPDRVGAPMGAQQSLVCNFEYGFSFDTDISIISEDWDDDWDDDWHGFDEFSWETTFILFFDTGMAWEDRSAQIEMDALKSSAGIGMQLSDDVRLNLIKPLEDGGNDLLFQVRLKRMF